MISDLKSQTLHGSLMMGGATMGLRFLSIISGIILARLLDPRDFGVVALAGIVLSTTSLFSGLGMGMAVIQNRADRGRLAYQGFVVSVVSGGVLFLVVLAGAGLFASVLDTPDVVPVLRWMSVLVLLGSLATVPEGLLQKDLLFGRQSIAVMGSELLGIVVAVVLAYSGFGLWSLVFGPLAKSLSYLLMIWFLCPGWEWLIPKPWDRALTREMVAFGSQTTGGGLVSFFYSIIDNLLVGKWLGTVALGLYAKAYDFSLRTVDGIINFIGVVLFPSYAQLQEDKDRLARAYFKSLRLLSFFTVPIALGMFITAPEMISVLLGEKWVPMIHAFEILAFVGVVKPLSGTTGALFASTGKPGYNLRAGILITLVMVPLIIGALAFGMGIAFVAASVLTAHLVGFGFNMYQLHRLLPGRAMEMVRSLIPALTCGVVMVAGVALVKLPLFLLAGGRHTSLTIAGMVAVGAVLYGALLFWWQRPLVSEVVAMVARKLRPRPV